VRDVSSISNELGRMERGGERFERGSTTERISNRDRDRDRDRHRDRDNTSDRPWWRDSRNWDPLQLGGRNYDKYR
jgi:hypothetical protein